MKRILACAALAGLLAGLLVGGAVLAGEADKPTGYLSGDAAVDATTFLPPPPAQDSVQLAADDDIFLRMRTLEGTERWKLAREDDKLMPDDLYKDFSCAFGFEVTSKSAPKLTALILKAASDAGHAIGTGKASFKRPRPLVGNDLAICVPRGRYADSYSYPSGHSTLSWTFASIMMQLLPERAGAIALRARAFGESRAVCGVHWASDVEAGRTAASVVFSALQAQPAYRSDLAAAHKELTALAKTAPKPDAKSCSALQSNLVRPW